MICDQGSEMVGATAKVALGWRAPSGPSTLRVEYGQTDPYTGILPISSVLGLVQNLPLVRFK